MSGSEEILSDLTVGEFYEITAESFVNSDILNSIFEDIPLIMILVNQDGKVENINRATTIALGKEKKDSIGLLRGELFGCVNSIKGEGCGKNRECSECTVRNSVMHTFETGESIYKQEGELEIVTNGQSVTLKFLISTTLLQYNNGPLVLLTVDDITEQKLSERAIKESEMKYKELADSLPQTIFETDLQGNLIFVNTHAFEMFGYAQEDFDKGFNIFRALIPEDLDRAKRNFEEAIHGDDIKANEYTALRKDGSTFPVNIYASRIIHDGKATGSRGILLDITERKMAEKELRLSKEKYSNLVENGNDGIVIIQDYVLKYANKKMVELSEFSIGEVIGKPFINFVSPDYRDLVKERYKRRLSGESIPNHYEIEIISNNGKKIPIDVNASTIEYEGRPADMAILRDITERKETEKEMRLKDKVFESALSANSTADVDGIINHANAAFLEIWGYNNLEEVIGHPIPHFFVNPDDALPILESLNKTEKWKGNYLAKRKDGSTFIAESLAGTMRNEEGELIGYHSSVIDVTKRKQAEVKLRESENKHSTLVEKGNDGIIVIQDYVIIFANS